MKEKPALIEDSGSLSVLGVLSVLGKTFLRVLSRELKSRFCIIRKEFHYDLRIIFSDCSNNGLKVFRVSILCSSSAGFVGMGRGVASESGGHACHTSPVNPLSVNVYQNHLRKED